MNTKLLLVDDHLSTLETLKCTLPLLLTCTIAGTARNAAEALDVIQRTAPDVVWVDVGLPGLDGPGLLRVLRLRHIPARSVLFTGTMDMAEIREALTAAPACMVSKNDDLACWQKALEAAVRGGTYYSPSIADAWKLAPDPGIASLSDAEHVVFNLMVKKLGEEHMAEMLGIATHTVRHHSAQMMAKLRAHTVEELRTIASRNGLLN